jgi:hypothetical protein
MDDVNCVNFACYSFCEEYTEILGVNSGWEFTPYFMEVIRKISVLEVNRKELVQLYDVVFSISGIDRPQYHVGRVSVVLKYFLKVIIFNFIHFWLFIVPSIVVFYSKLTLPSIFINYLLKDEDISASFSFLA